jgi:hypothetical protein
MKSALCNLHSAISVALIVCAACSACQRTTREEARAVDEWTRSYPLAAGGRVVISNRNGSIEIEGGEGSTVDVRAERVVRATTAKTAGDVLPRIRITEDIKPDLVSIRTEGIEGLLVGVSFDVTYRVRVPAGAGVRVQTSNGDITVTGVSGRLVANSANGNIKGEKLGGGVETRTNNGLTAVDLNALGVDPIVMRGTNGNLELVLPAETDANLTASTVEGEVTVTGLTVEPTGEPGPGRGRGRRLRGRLNAGGTSIELQTVHGNITISARVPSGQQKD